MDIGIEGIEDVEEVGSGGSSIVYRARQVALDRYVAVKVLTIRFGAGEDAERRRFAREQRALGRLSDLAGIVPLYASGFTALEQPYLIMPYYESRSLQQRLDNQGPLPWEEASRLMAVVGRAVQRAHENNVLHRDIKPANIMIDRDGEPLVGDFGVARLLGSTTMFQSRALLATPAFSPPEVFAGDEVSASVDVYGLGASLFALVNGSPAFISQSGDMNVLALMRRVDFDPVPDLRPRGVPPQIAAVIERSMAKAPGDRHAGALRWVADLEAATAAATVTAAEPVEADTTADEKAPSHSEAGDDAPTSTAVVVTDAPTADDPDAQRVPLPATSPSDDPAEADPGAAPTDEDPTTTPADDEPSPGTPPREPVAPRVEDQPGRLPDTPKRTPDPALKWFRTKPALATPAERSGVLERVSTWSRRAWADHPAAVLTIVLVVVFGVFGIYAYATYDDDRFEPADFAAEDGTITEGNEAEFGANTGEVSIFGYWTGVDADATQTVVDAAIDGEDFTATYTGSESYFEEVASQIEGGTPPDIAVFGPGQAIEQAEAGNAIALEDLGFDISDLEEKFGAHLLSLGQYEGKHYGLPLGLSYKSAIWYPKAAWEEAGWGDPPATWEELMALSTEIAESGTSPWCMGTESDFATGWPATDWMEEIVLRDQGTDVYDQWVSHEVVFDSPEITAAAERFGEIVFGEAGGTSFVFGGHESISSTRFSDAPAPMFNDPPNCFMHRQAMFVSAFFPDDLEPGVDYDFFPFPDMEGNSGTLMGGDLAAVFNDRPEVKTFLDNYTDAENQCLFGSTGSTTISANFNVDLECYEKQLIRQAAASLQESLREGVARFDASDLMPPAVGTGEFWRGMVLYTDNGPDDLEEVLSSIDAAWPSP